MVGVSIITVCSPAELNRTLSGFHVQTKTFLNKTKTFPTNHWPVLHPVTDQYSTPSLTSTPPHHWPSLNHFYSDTFLFCLWFSRITFCHLPFQSKWLYVGTERGNTHIVNIESFILSGYVIMWNKAIELWVADVGPQQWPLIGPLWPMMMLMLVQKRKTNKGMNGGRVTEWVSVLVK